MIVLRGISCPAACGIFLSQGSNPCPLHWQADSRPTGSPGKSSTTVICSCCHCYQGWGGWPQCLRKAEKQASLPAFTQYFQKQMLTTRFGPLVEHDVARIPGPLARWLKSSLTNCPCGGVADLKPPVMLAQGFRVQISCSLLASNTFLCTRLQWDLPWSCLLLFHWAWRLGIEWGLRFLVNLGKSGKQGVKSPD